MTFTTRLKEEISSNMPSPIEARVELSAYIRFAGKITKNEIILVLENAAVARRIYKFLKKIYNINILLNIRTQKRFRNKQIYILTVKEKTKYILEDLDIYKNNRKTLPEEYFSSTAEDKIAFLKGTFLACGNISDPRTSGYHLGFSIKTRDECLYILKLLKEFSFNGKYIKRYNNYMVYIKESETISDIIKMFNAINSLFYFEDIRIYRDHKNMVNRLNNCEIANQEKVIKTSISQLDTIKFIKENDLTDLLDEKTRIIMDYREKYPDTSFQELANIISLETDFKIGKSGVNHHFIKLKELKQRYEENIK